MGITAENVAAQWNVSREDQDAFAYGSHQKALAAIQSGHFSAEISPYDVVVKSADLAGSRIITRNKTLANDEGPRADTSLEGLAKL